MTAMVLCNILQHLLDHHTDAQMHSGVTIILPCSLYHVSISASVFIARSGTERRRGWKGRSDSTSPCRERQLESACSKSRSCFVNVEKAGMPSTWERLHDDQALPACSLPRITPDMFY